MKIKNLNLIFFAMIMISILCLVFLWSAQLIISSAKDTADRNPGDTAVTPESSGPDLSQIYLSHSSGFYESAIMLEMYPPEKLEI